MLDPGRTCVTLLAVLPLIAVVWAIAMRGRIGRGILVLAGGLTTAVAIAGVAGLTLPVTCSTSIMWEPGVSTDAPPLGTWQLRFDATIGLFLAALGLAVSLLGVTARTAPGRSRSIVLAMWMIAVWFWLVDTVWLAVILQGALLALGFLLIAAQPAGSVGGGAARTLWLTVCCADVALLLVALGWSLESGAASFSDAGSAAAVSQVASRTSAAVSALGTLLWLGTLGRTLQFPFGLACDHARQPHGLTMGAVTTLPLGAVGWRWLAAGQVWFGASPQAGDLVSAGSALGGLAAAWFALCSDDPRTRVAWLATVPWSFAASAMLENGSAGHWTSLMIAITGLLASAWLYGLWESDEVESATDTPTPGASPMFFFRSVGGGQVVSGQFSGKLEQVFQLFTGGPGTASTTGAVTARGGRLAVLVGCVGLLLAPAMLGQVGDRSDSVVVTMSSPDSAENDGAPARTGGRPRWPGWARSAALGLAALAATLLISETQTSSETRFPAGLVAGGGVVLFSPWIMFGAPPFADVRTQLIADSRPLATACAAVAVGVLAGVWESRRSGAAPRRRWIEPWSRLGKRRLYLRQICFFGLNLPIRGLAQVTRFLDWFLWDAIVARTLGRLPRWGSDAEIDLHRSEPGFYALSFCLAATAVAFTLMWLGQ